MRRITLGILTLAAMQAGSLCAESGVVGEVGSEATGATAAAPTAVVFDGLGLECFAGAASIASALRGIEAEERTEEPPLGVPLDMLVRGPSARGNASDPLAAELKSRVDRFDLTAGMQADPNRIQEAPATWVGGLGVSTDHERGREVLELKTSLRKGQQVGMFGVEVGPRIERRLRGGTVFFLDGKAQAQARRSVGTGEWMMPRLAEQGTGGTGMVGVSASTGLVR